MCGEEADFAAGEDPRPRDAAHQLAPWWL